MGRWVSKQRTNKDQLTSDQLKRLNSLGFSWDPFAEQWERNFAALQKFHKREGNCLVAASYQESGLNLGNWVGTQRTNKDRLTPDQLNRLNSLGFSWDPFAEQWEEGFAALLKFRKREGHSRVPQRHNEDGLNLGSWVSNLRTNKDRLTQDQLERLNSLGFVWKGKRGPVPRSERTGGRRSSGDRSDRS